MKEILNTLFITTPEIYLRADGENVVVWKDDEKLARFPCY